MLLPFKHQREGYTQRNQDRGFITKTLYFIKYLTLKDAALSSEEHFQNAPTTLHGRGFITETLHFIKYLTLKVAALSSEEDFKMHKQHF